MSAEGIPVVAYNIGGISEVIEDAKNGFLIPFGNMAQMVEKVNEISGDSEMYESMSGYGIKKARDFDVKSMVKKTLQLYQGLV